MRIHVVSDVHGNAEALARAGDGADALLVLGDLLDFVDYHDHARGILGRIFGPDKVATLAQLRRGSVPAETATYARSLWASLADAGDAIDVAMREQYETLFAAMPTPTYAMPGNVDAPWLWPEFAQDGVHVLDDTTATIGGCVFGFVGGALLPPGGTRRRTGGWTPYLRTQAEYASAIDDLPEVDVVCTHIPPAVPELTYDVVARHGEFGSDALLRWIRENGPRAALFGHVHQPLAQRMRIGWTECVNVGHFQRTGEPYVLEL